MPEHRRLRSRVGGGTERYEPKEIESATRPGDTGADDPVVVSGEIHGSAGAGFASPFGSAGTEKKSTQGSREEREGFHGSIV